MSAPSVAVYPSEYEAYFNLIAVQGPEQQNHGRLTYTTTAWCLDEACQTEGEDDWNVTRSHYQDARLAGLQHCREVHVRGPWR